MALRVDSFFFFIDGTFIFLPKKTQQTKWSKGSQIFILHNKTKYEAQNWITWTFLFLSPPSSKCLHLLIASILSDLQLGSMHSRLSTIFFVVWAFFRKSGSACPPQPLCSLPQRRFPWAYWEPLPFLYASLCGAGAPRTSHRKPGGCLERSPCLREW